MTDNVVVPLPGYAIPTPKGAPVEGIVDALREALALAESGQLTGLGLALVIDDSTQLPLTRSTMHWSAGQFRATYFAIAQLHRQAGRYADE